MVTSRVRGLDFQDSTQVRFWTTFSAAPVLLAENPRRWPKKGSRVRFAWGFGLVFMQKGASGPVFAAFQGQKQLKIVHASPFLAIATEKLPTHKGFSTHATKVVHVFRVFESDNVTAQCVQGVSQGTVSEQHANIGHSSPARWLG